MGFRKLSGGHLEQSVRFIYLLEMLNWGCADYFKLKAVGLPVWPFSKEVKLYIYSSAHI